MSTTPTVLITGTTSGLGRSLATALGARGWCVLAHGRDQRRLDAVVDGLRSRGIDARAYRADLASLAQTAELAARVAADNDQLQLLVNNAGVGSGPPRGGREFSQDGHELRLAVNYLAPVVLTRQLLPVLRASAPAQVLNIGSVGMAPVDVNDPQLDNGYEGMKAYMRSKYALLAFTVDTARELQGTGVRVNCVHPATYMDTGMVRESQVRPWTSVDTGAAAALSIIESPKLTTGRFYNGSRPSGGEAVSHDDAGRRRLATLTEQLVASHITIPK